VAIRIVVKDHNTDESGALFPVPQWFSVPLSPSYRITFFRNGSLSSYRLDRREGGRAVVVGLTIRLTGFVDLRYCRCLFVGASTVRVQSLA
jgi:hypothetical protein